MQHGTNGKVVCTLSKLTKGKYGRIARGLDPWWPEDVPLGDFTALRKFFSDFANSHMVEELDANGTPLLPKDLVDDEDLRDKNEQRFASKTPAGYTYFGQFVDHDITHDPTSFSERKRDIDELINFRTPALDLDCVYGAGPKLQPYMYVDADSKNERGVHRIKFALSRVGNNDKVPDLLRFGSTAVIGDNRNDENAIVAQVHLAFQLAHNRLVDRAIDHLKKQGISYQPKIHNEKIFERARQTLVWLYQHIVWNDFIPRICINEYHREALKKDSSNNWVLGFKDIYDFDENPFIPVEFSQAVYRFGHSMVRNHYRLNSEEPGGTQHFIRLFSKEGDSLRGQRALTERALVQWDWFLEMTTSQAGAGFPQMAKKIDTKLANALSFLPDMKAPDNVLALLNLIRGVDGKLPPGTKTATKFGEKPVALGKNDIDALWYYILKEAERSPSGGLGRLGSKITCAVFAGLLLGDKKSVFSEDVNWSPNTDPLLHLGEDNIDAKSNEWTLASIIRIAGLKSNGVGIG